MPNRTLKCSTCESPMWGGKTAKKDGTQKCHPCRRKENESPTRDCVECGRTFKRTKNSRCAPCRYAATKAHKAALGHICIECPNVATVGDLCITHYSYKHREANGRKRSPGGKREWYIHPDRRLAIYERDGWVCQLCGKPVDRALHGQGVRDAPSLDHIIPQSHQLIPDHSDKNLRLSHLGCNAKRRDRVDDIDLAAWEWHGD